MPSSWPSRFCCDEDLALLGYDGRDAEKELASWLSRGPRSTTLELINAIRDQGVEGAVLLDIGAGVGVIHTTLLEAGAASAVDVDASRQYLAAAKGEAERRGVAGRVTYLYGDVVELAADLPPAEIVTLDSVICCYPYLPPLLEAAVRSKPRLVGLTYPRDVWWMFAFARLWNAAHALRRSPIRGFIYRHNDVRRLMGELGYAEIHDGGSAGWRVVLYGRD
jgi:magnesium-protoporphyrin O-methyltransferase